MDGEKALTEIRARMGNADLRIAAFTAHAMVGDRDRVLEAGFNGYLTKPI